MPAKTRHAAATKTVKVTKSLKKKAKKRVRKTPKASDRRRLIAALTKTLMRFCGLGHMRGYAQDKGYRQKIDLHLSASYGDTFALTSYWYENPNEKLFFAQIFRMAVSAAASESGTPPPLRIYSQDDVAKVFVKKGKHVNVDEASLERLGCTKSILKSFLGQTPAADPPGVDYIIVPRPPQDEVSDVAVACGGAKAKQDAASTVRMKELSLCELKDTSPVRREGFVGGGGEEEEEEEKKVGRHSGALTAAAAADELAMDIVTTDDDDDDNDDDDGDGDGDGDSCCGDDDAARYLPDFTPANGELYLDFLSSQPMESGASQSFDMNDLWVDEAPTAFHPSECAVAAVSAAAQEIVLQDQERLDKLCKLGKQLEIFSAVMSDVVSGGDARRLMSEHVAALQQLMSKQLQQANVQLEGLEFLMGDASGEESRE